MDAPFPGRTRRARIRSLPSHGFGLTSRLLRPAISTSPGTRRRGYRRGCSLRSGSLFGRAEDREQCDQCGRERESLETLVESPADDARLTSELLERAPVLYLKRDDEERARLLRAVVSNCMIRRGNVDPVYKKPFDVVAVGVETGEWWRRADSNRQPLRCERSALPIRATPPGASWCS